jgi:hypothetical protein
MPVTGKTGWLIKCGIRSFLSRASYMIGQMWPKAEISQTLTKTSLFKSSKLRMYQKDYMIANSWKDNLSTREKRLG